MSCKFRAKGDGWKGAGRQENCTRAILGVGGFYE